MTKNTASGWTWIIKLESDKHTGLLKLVCKLGLHTSYNFVSMGLYHNTFFGYSDKHSSLLQHKMFCKIEHGQKKLKKL